MHKLPYTSKTAHVKAIEEFLLLNHSIPQTMQILSSLTSQIQPTDY